MTPYEKVLEALEKNQLVSGGWGTGLRARCPSHDDTRPSLSVGEGDDGRALVYCFAGCELADIMAGLGLSVSDLFEGGTGDEKGTVVAQYVYTDEAGTPLIRVSRTTPKGFFQERYEDGEWKAGLRDTRRTLFNLPAIIAADTVWIVEGEKDVLSLEGEGVVATTCLGGSSNWRDEYADTFAGKDVVLVGDQDEAGERFISEVRLSLLDVAKSIRVLAVASGTKDVTDHLQMGYELGELSAAVDTDLSVFEPIDWRTYEGGDTEWLFEPYVPVGGRTLVFGKRGSLKSLWAMWLASHLSREGKRVAYFSIEMQPTDTVRRLRQLNPDPDNLLVFTKELDLTNPSHVDKLLLGLRNFDLIVIDSWSSVHQFGRSRLNQNDEVAALDKEVLQPLIRETGATIMLVDNQGWGGQDEGAHVRGASAKEDKMETCLWFERPKDYDNYLTRLAVTKMRLDHPMPEPVDIRTPEDRIEFYEAGTNRPHWPGMWVAPEATDLAESASASSGVSPAPSASPVETEEARRVREFEERKLARLKGVFGATEATV